MSGQAQPLRMQLLGVTTRVTGLPPQMRADLSALLRPFVVSDRRMAREPADVTITLRETPDAGVWQALLDGEEMFRSSYADRLLRNLEWLVVAQSVARTPERIAWHAASLAWGRRAVILVAESGAGKSTLTLGLALRGWRPLADDLTLLDPATGALDLLRRCFHIEAPTDALLPSADLLTRPAPSLAEYARPRRWGPAGSQPAWVVLVRRDSSQPASLTPITQAEAAGALYVATIKSQVAPATVARLAAQVAGSAQGCWALNNGDLNDTLDLLTSTLLGSAMERRRASGEWGAAMLASAGGARV